MTVFKKCTSCGYEWSSRQEFLAHIDTELVGYQVHFEKLELGFFLFNHMTCRSTFSIHAAKFLDLYDGPVFSERFIGTEPCPGYCLQKEILCPCSAPCECAYVREILQIVRHWPKCDYHSPQISAVAG